MKTTPGRRIKEIKIDPLTTEARGEVIDRRQAFRTLARRDPTLDEMLDRRKLVAVARGEPTIDERIERGKTWKNYFKGMTIVGGVATALELYFGKYVGNPGVTASAAAESRDIFVGVITFTAISWAVTWRLREGIDRMQRWRQEHLGSHSD